MAYNSIINPNNTIFYSADDMDIRFQLCSYFVLLPCTTKWNEVLFDKALNCINIINSMFNICLQKEQSFVEFILLPV